MVIHDPLHRSGRADFPHSALASGHDAHAAQRIVMVDASRREPARNQPPDPIPGNTALLTAARERTLPTPAHPVSEGSSAPRNSESALA